MNDGKALPYDLLNCVVCGRLVNYQRDPGYHLAQVGGYVCTPCSKWLQRKAVTCPRCGGKFGYGPYHERCECANPPRVTRSGRHYEMEV